MKREKRTKHERNEQRQKIEHTDRDDAEIEAGCCPIAVERPKQCSARAFIAVCLLQSFPLTSCLQTGSNDIFTQHWDIVAGDQGPFRFRRCALISYSLKRFRWLANPKKPNLKQPRSTNQHWSLHQFGPLQFPPILCTEGWNQAFQHMYAINTTSRKRFWAHTLACCGRTKLWPKQKTSPSWQHNTSAKCHVT